MSLQFATRTPYFIKIDDGARGVHYHKVHDNYTFIL